MEKEIEGIPTGPRTFRAYKCNKCGHEWNDSRGCTEHCPKCKSKEIEYEVVEN